METSIYNIIIGDLACRVEQIRRRCSRNPMFVPCGRIARVSMNQVRASLRRMGVEICIYQGNVPHPAYRREQPNYQSDFEALNNSIKLRIQGTRRGT